MTASSRRVLRFLALVPLFLVPVPSRAAEDPPARPGAAGLFARDNLIAWCIVPFDSKKRGPEERAAMLERLGFRHFAYDWRAEHIPTFDAEIDALKRHGVALDAFWVAPGELNKESQLILDTLKRHGVEAQLWVLLDLGGDRVTGAEQERRVQAAAAKLRPLAEAGRQGGVLAGPVQSRRLVRRAREPARDPRRACRHRGSATSASSTTSTTATSTSTGWRRCSPSSSRTWWRST